MSNTKTLSPDQQEQFREEAENEFTFVIELDERGAIDKHNNEQSIRREGYIAGRSKSAEEIARLEAELEALKRDNDDKVYFLDEMRRNADECIKRTEKRIAAYDEMINTGFKPDGIQKVDIQTVEFVRNEAKSILQMMRMI